MTLQGRCVLLGRAGCMQSIVCESCQLAASISRRMARQALRAGAVSARCIKAASRATPACDVSMHVTFAHACVEHAVAHAWDTRSGRWHEWHQA